MSLVLLVSEIFVHALLCLSDIFCQSTTMKKVVVVVVAVAAIKICAQDESVQNENVYDARHSALSSAWYELTHKPSMRMWMNKFAFVSFACIFYSLNAN